MTQVLVVDDSLSVRKALEIMLRPLAFTVRMADGAEAAMRALAQERADLVIADVLMPGESGFTLCARVRALQGAPAVVLISGIVGDEESARAREAGAFGLVKKPFRAEELLPVVRAALAARPVSRSEQAPARQDAEKAPAHDVPDVWLGALLEKQGVLGALLLGEDGAVQARRGEAVPGEVASYLRFFAGTARGLGARLEDGWDGALLEFGRRAVLLAPLGPRTLAVVLRDAGAANVVKYLLRAQREKVGATSSS